jgi:uncharacterized membrane protein HdeD (DUF308 family)
MPVHRVDPHPSDEVTDGLLAGLGLLLVGALALNFSHVSALVTVMLLGIALALGGTMVLREAHAKHRGWRHLVVPLLVLALGLALVVRPHGSLRVVTPLLMGVFLLDGLFLMTVALREREGAWPAELVTGAVNLALGMWLALRWRSAGMGLVGTLTGLYLLSRGAMFLTTSALRYARLPRTPPRGRRRRLR